MKSRERHSVEHDGLGGFERRVFQIEANGQAFRTLIDGLYENKIGAVVRELWSNAVDSHVEANQERPFLVEVPTMLDPTFRIRDFGVSLSHDDVMGLYSTIFRTTKGDSNEQVGKFGLGSKSPFAYGDTFVVVAYLDGLKRTYVANIMDDDLPEIRHLSTEATTEPQGFEVSIPVSTGDFRKFEREVTRMLLATDQRPEVSGLSIEVPDPVLSGDGWRIFNRTYDMGDFAVRQGCVMYPVHSIYAQIDSGHLFVADVTIGSCEITASREALSMDSETEQAVKEAYDRSWTGVTAFINSLTYANRLDEFQQRDRYSFVHGVSRKNHLSLAPDRRNKELPGQTILTYSPHRVTKPSWESSFSYPESLYLIVDDIRPGEKFLRRQLRIKEYVKGIGDHSGRKVAVVGREALPRIVRLLGIKPENVTSLSQLPDVQIIRNYSGNGRTAGGVTGTAAPKELPAGSWWVRKVGAISLAEGSGRWNYNHGDLEAHGKVSEFWSQTHHLLTLLNFGEDQIVFLTDKQAAKFDPTEAQRLTHEVTRRAVKYAADNSFSTRFIGHENTKVFNQEMSLHWSTWNNDHQAISNEAYLLLRGWVTAELGLAGDDSVSSTYGEDMIAQLAGISFSATLTSEDIKSKVDEYKKAYPLLFLDGGQSLTDFYIQTQDDKENHK